MFAIELRDPKEVGGVAALSDLAKAVSAYRHR